jgi:2-oxoglutarate ferredoxin oxidoreductase subunit alpha
VRELIDGATATVRGALAAGCDFFAGYPITPATPILLHMMQQMPKTGGIAIEGEDEIASIGLCIGAAASGRRVLTATSGPGMSLYSENIGLAVMAELPLVIVDVQRLGPSTGGATTIGQGDVQFARWGTGGGYPLIVLAPSSTVECATLVVEAFALAERFRTPVILLSDKELNLTKVTVDWPELPRDRMKGIEPVGQPLAPFGGPNVTRFTGSTHDEEQAITKDPSTVESLNRWLLSKFSDHLEELAYLRTDLQPGADTVLISYGTAAGAMEAAVARSRAAGKRVSGVVVQSLWPVPEQRLRDVVEGAARIVVGELNPGLYVREMRCLFPDLEVISLNRIDGRLIEPVAYVELCL